MLPCGEQTKLFDLETPSFEIAYPKLLHSDLIPEHFWGTMGATWKTGRFPRRHSSVYLLKDVYVAEHGLVFGADGNLFPPSRTQHASGEVDRGSDSIRQSLPMASISGLSVLCVKRGMQNYGHWLMEMLPKAAFNKLYGPPCNYIVPSIAGPINQAIDQSLSMLQISTEMRIGLDGIKPLRVEELLFIDGLTHHGSYMSPFAVESVSSLGLMAQGQPAQKLFIIRQGSRLIEDQPVICQYAIDQGYRIVDTAGMSLLQQMATFKHATHIVGAMGASMTNIVFAPHYAKVVILAPEKMPDTFFWFLSGHKGQDYTEVRCQQVGPITGVAPWDTNIRVDPRDFEIIFP